MGWLPANIIIINSSRPTTRILESPFAGVALIFETFAQMILRKSFTKDKLVFGFCLSSITPFFPIPFSSF